MHLLQWNIDGICSGNDPFMGSISFDPLGNFSRRIKLVIRNLLCIYQSWTNQRLITIYQLEHA